MTYDMTMINLIIKSNIKPHLSKDTKINPKNDCSTNYKAPASNLNCLFKEECFYSHHLQP